MTKLSAVSRGSSELLQTCMAGVVGLVRRALGVELAGDEDVVVDVVQGQREALTRRLVEPRLLLAAGGGPGGQRQQAGHEGEAA